MNPASDDAEPTRPSESTSRARARRYRLARSFFSVDVLKRSHPVAFTHALFQCFASAVFDATFSLFSASARLADAWPPCRAGRSLRAERQPPSQRDLAGALRRAHARRAPPQSPRSPSPRVFASRRGRLFDRLLQPRPGRPPAQPRRGLAQWIKVASTTLPDATPAPNSPRTLLPASPANGAAWPSPPDALKIPARDGTTSTYSPLGTPVYLQV